MGEYRQETLNELLVVADKRKQGYLDAGKDYLALAVIWGFLALLVKALKQAPF